MQSDRLKSYPHTLHEECYISYYQQNSTAV